MILENLKKDSSYVITIAGMRGQGKTYLATRWFEEIDKQDKVIYIDVVGALKNYASENKMDLQVLTIDAVVSSSKLEEVLSNIFSGERIKKVLFDLSSLKRRDLIYTIDIIFSWLIKHGADYSVLIDEVGEIIPQNHLYYSEETERLIRIGRNKGIKKVVITTQRLQQADKTAVAQSNYYIFFKMIHNLDLRAIREIQGVSQDEFLETRVKIKKLDIGEFIVSDGTKEEGVYRYDARKKEIVEVTPFEKVSVFSKEQEKKIEGINQRKLIDEATKKEAVNKWVSGKNSLKELSQQYGVSQVAVHKWVKKYNKKKK
jgi:hypothetical protein